jgi:3-deoxy-manno-octulosonate cytidylyltransferase (CMP-KDO synthetase)
MIIKKYLIFNFLILRLLDAQIGKFIMAKTLILIPSRMSASRLPGKPLLAINNLSIISHVFKKAEETNIGEVVVATEDQEILDDVEKNGGRAVLTSNTHKTGTDRIFEAYEKLNIKDIDFILNLQGDEPNIDKNDIINLNNFMINSNSGIGTLAAEIKMIKC